MNRCCVSEEKSRWSLGKPSELVKWVWELEKGLEWWRAAELLIVVVVMAPSGFWWVEDLVVVGDREKKKEEKRGCEVGVDALIVTPHLVSSSCSFFLFFFFFFIIFIFLFTSNLNNKSIVHYGNC